MAVITRYDAEGYPIIAPQEGPQEMFCSTTADICFYGGMACGGKAQPIDSLVCTPFGFKKMGDIKVGSQISNPDGSVARVIAIWPQGIKKVYKVICDDGSTCECTEDHLWLYRLGRKTRKTENQWLIGTTSIIKSKLKNNSVIIPLASATQFTLPSKYKNSVFPIAPYFLGALIGDGCFVNKQVRITSADEEIINRIGIKVKRIYKKQGSTAKEYFYNWSDVSGLERIGLYGKKSDTKFIPEQYKSASIEYRIEIMKGLMDTDGYVDDRGHGSYTTTSKELAKDVQFIARSLGYTASITSKTPEYTYNAEIKSGALAYTVWIGGKDISDIVSLQRKKDRCVDKSKINRSIKSIEYVRDAECQCITVDHPNQLYITNDFIVTHNSFALLMEAARGVHDPHYTAVIFRRKYIEITQPGGLWDTSEVIYPSLEGQSVKGNVEWRFPKGCSIKMMHLNHEETKKEHQGGQYTFIGFDELTHFTRSQFLYLLSRNRSPAGCTLKPYIRCTFNAEPGWVADWIQWYWDPETGYPIPERSGVIRHFTIKGNDLIWVSKEYRDKDGLPPKSFTFISASMDDNPLGMIANPEYKATINSLDHVTRERLGKSNFLIQEGGNMFKPEWFEIVDSAPAGMKMIRYWDFAATEVSEKDKNDPDWTAGALCGIWDNVLYIVDINFFRESPGQTEQNLITSANQDGRDVEIWWEEEKGSAGKYTSHYLRSVFKGYDAHPDPVSGQKVDRAKPWSAWAEFGRVKLVRGAWNRQFLSWASQFPDGKRDVIDAVSGCFKVLNGPDRVFKWYVSSPTGHFRTFPIDHDAFEKVDKAAVEVYGVLYANKQGQIFGAVYVYSLNARRLRQYGEIISPEPISSRIAYEMQQKLVVPCYDKPEFASLKKIYCNETMMDYGKGSIAKELRKYGLKLHLNLIYDEPGAIHTMNDMMAENRFIVHSSCKESDVQFRGMRYENKKVPDGNELARCGLILVSQLRAQMARESVKIAPPYSKRKMNVRDTLKTSGELQHSGKKSEYDYMV